MPEGFKEKPEDVQSAIAQGNKKKLSRMGGRGGKQAAENRRRRIDERVTEELEYIDGPQLNILDENGDVIPDETLSPEEVRAGTLKRAQKAFNPRPGKSILQKMTEQMPKQSDENQSTEEGQKEECPEMTSEEVSATLQRMRDTITAMDPADAERRNYDDKSST